MSDNKTALLICPQFFGYENEIKKALEKKGYAVDYLADRPFKSNFIKTFSRLLPTIINNLYERKFGKLLTEFNSKNYSLIFVVSGECLTSKLVFNLRQHHPSALLIFYTWDSFRNKKNTFKIYNLFDIKASFDPNDCEQYGLNYRPLFYVDGYDKSEHKQEPVYKISFAGTAHSDRVKIVHQIKSSLGDYENYFFLYLQAKWVFLVYKIINKNYRNISIKEISFVPKSKKDLQVIFEKSKAILDIEHPKQIGFTMRTFEALGASKKLITTNKNILKADFYNANNVLVIDRFKPIIPKMFLESDYVIVEQKLQKKYSIDGWLNELLNFGKSSYE